MLFALVTFQPQDKSTEQTAKFWIDTIDSQTAQNQIELYLANDGCSLLSIIECTATSKDDYFPPCTSYDAMLVAEKEGIAVLY